MTAGDACARALSRNELKCFRCCWLERWAQNSRIISVINSYPKNIESAKFYYSYLFCYLSISNIQSKTGSQKEAVGVFANGEACFTIEYHSLYMLMHVPTFCCNSDLLVIYINILYILLLVPRVSG